MGKGHTVEQELTLTDFIVSDSEMKLCFSSSASLFLVIIISNFIQFSEAQDNVLKLPSATRSPTNASKQLKPTWNSEGITHRTRTAPTTMKPETTASNQPKPTRNSEGFTPRTTTTPTTMMPETTDNVLKLPSATRSPTNASKQPKTTRNSEGYTDRTTTTPTTKKPETRDDILNLSTATRSPTKASEQPKPTRNSKGFTHRTRTTPTTKKPEPRDNKLNLSTSTSTTKSSKQPKPTRNSKGFTHRIRTAPATKKPETRAPIVYIWALVLSLAAVILLGVTAVCLYRRRKNRRSAGIQQEPANNTEYSLLGLAGNLNADNTAGKEQIIYSIADHPSSGKPPTYELVGSGGNTAQQEDHQYASIGDLSSAAVTEQNPVYSLLQNH
ncbi:salivary glue protein Sgs-3-like [Brienomyrus brachyistius]|uniref:salivary glue protein Sgs-3-like n=1 Tax=Brienomyrus brachyistius TaxID=42636 RepID=UPI0020B405B5|nr:salivary glue protein Sgs-3-like [Brienomyrus brachyistius]